MTHGQQYINACNYRPTRSKIPENTRPELHRAVSPEPPLNTSQWNDSNTNLQH